MTIAGILTCYSSFESLSRHLKYPQGLKHLSKHWRLGVGGQLVIKHKPETVKCHFKNAMFIVMSSQALEIFARPEIFCKNYHLMVWTLVKCKPEVSIKLPALRLQTYSWFCNRN